MWKKTHGGVLLLVELQDRRLKACNFTKSNTPPCIFFTFSKLYKWCQIAQTKNIGELNKHNQEYWRAQQHPWYNELISSNVNEIIKTILDFFAQK